ncbi:SufD family Fe-S cluster assembly protein [Veillonella sp.]|uniref:SufB/SufD family protein n=1 Tax=Veillonella sp. TaxID=1926307 RepID=UPI001B5F1375|nr:SufD family Fe-S cluster assembly protein [Veillonella sp.]MBP9551365.1 SufD family Fe-S cluster assembly protein [Veillonella sp.]
MSENLLFNVLPRPTFRWLHVNHTQGQVLGATDERANVVINANAGVVTPLINTELVKATFPGVNPTALQNLISTGEAHLITVPANGKEVVIIEVNAAKRIASRFQFHVGDRAELEVLILMTGDAKDTSVETFTEFIIGEEANVVVKKVNLISEELQQIEHRYTKLADRANVEFINIEIGGKENILHFEQDLAGEECELIHDLAYLGDKEQKFDIFMLMSHGGKKSKSDIHTLGALSDVSKKSFRGTLDFLHGATGSEGAEEDTCLLLDPTVKSVSLPLLLCKEDNVVGNHAASAGQLDKTKLFYLMSRGFSEAEAKHIIVESMIRPIIDRIGNEDIEEAALTAVRNKI